VKRQIYHFLLGLAGAFALMGCEGQSPAPSGPTPPAQSAGTTSGFAQVNCRITPAATKICQQQGSVRDCRFQVVLDDRSEIPPGALVSDTRNGAFIVISGAMLQQTRNDDELAFVIAHMAGHHIDGHREGDNQMAMAQAVLSGAQGMISGNVASVVNTAIRLNEAGKVRGFDSTEEVEADVLATRILWAAGYDPVAGHQIFQRRSGAMKGFFELHPTSAARQSAVTRVAQALK